ncbi:MAG TPA: 1-deoxy-D-xylulose-5-phosphate reductoisomerase [Alphaproteobacteria bacterium]|nr:1-deoxy-D-xylulose-5-phosphate reductoisomerase [Alphaproteobacteria bacterium]
MVVRAVETAPRRVTVLGSTGSVGCNTIDLVERNPNRFEVVALTANRNAVLLADQSRRLRPQLAVIADEAKYVELRDALAGTGVEVAAGSRALVEAAERPSDWVMAAIMGFAGLAPTLAAARRGAMVAFANKECLVSAGPLMMDQVRRYGATLLPVDSEHNAIFQVLDTNGLDTVERLILTASGGPFRTADRAAMAAATPAQAVAHPVWDMGAKISVDSATMMNKGLEIIEASHLFAVPEERIAVLIHPQSVVHSMVEYADGSVLAQMGTPDMRTPIAHALAWPSRMPSPSPRLDLTAVGRLDFAPPDTDRFPALDLARRALRCGGNAPTVLNAANEVAVAAFLEGRIGFLEIERIVGETMARLPVLPLGSLNDVYASDEEARATAGAFLTPHSP